MELTFVEYLLHAEPHNYYCIMSLYNAIAELPEDQKGLGDMCQGTHS
jgi:hypothetical protein